MLTYMIPFGVATISSALQARRDELKGRHYSIEHRKLSVFRLLSFLNPCYITLSFEGQKWTDRFCFQFVDARIKRAKTNLIKRLCFSKLRKQLNSLMPNPVLSCTSCQKSFSFTLKICETCEICG